MNWDILKKAWVLTSVQRSGYVTASELLPVCAPFMHAPVSMCIRTWAVMQLGLACVCLRMGNLGLHLSAYAAGCAHAGKNGRVQLRPNDPCICYHSHNPDQRRDREQHGW